MPVLKLRPVVIVDKREYPSAVKDLASQRAGELLQPKDGERISGDLTPDEQRLVDEAMKEQVQPKQKPARVEPKGLARQAGELVGLMVDPWPMTPEGKERRKKAGDIADSISKNEILGEAASKFAKRMFFGP